MTDFTALLRTDFFEYEEDTSDYLVFDNIVDYMMFMSNKPIDYPCSLFVSTPQTSVERQMLDAFTSILVEKYNKDIIDVPPRGYHGGGQSTLLNLSNIRNFSDKLDVKSLLLLFYTMPDKFSDLYYVFVRRWPYRRDLWALFIDIACVTKPTIYTCELHVDGYVHVNDMYSGPYESGEYRVQEKSPTMIKKLLDIYPVCKCVIKYKMRIYEDTAEGTIAQYQKRTAGKLHKSMMLICE